MDLESLCAMLPRESFLLVEMRNEMDGLHKVEISMLQLLML